MCYWSPLFAAVKVAVASDPGVNWDLLNVMYFLNMIDWLQWGLPPVLRLPDVRLSGLAC